MRLIDTDALLRAMCENCKYMMKGGKCRIHECIEHVQVREFPSVDAVEVVRCWECVHYYKNAIKNGRSEGVLCLASPMENAFCSEGKRREDETD